MKNFTYQNPTKIIFGRGEIAQIENEIPKDKKVLLVYGGGSIKKNGTYDQVIQALKNHDVIEFGGVEPNPEYETLMKAVKIVKEESVDFILAVGGGSTIDGTKFISFASYSDNPWEDMKKNNIQKALPFGAVLTLPATGSEMNGGAVVSRRENVEKFAFSSEKTFPKFSILDPELTFSLPTKQTKNGIADIFVHVCEQYLTRAENAPLQSRQAEAVLSTLLEEAPKVLLDPNDYDARANIMWAGTNGLNFWLSVGQNQCWGTHMLGHILTAEFGIDHGQTLTIIMPALMKKYSQEKSERLVQLGTRVFNLKTPTPEQTIEKIEDFFRSIDMPVRLSDKDVSLEKCSNIPEKAISWYGDHVSGDVKITKEDMVEILRLAA